MSAQLAEVPKTEGLKLDLGCGNHPKEGFLGVDALQMKGVDVVADLRQRWPWDDGSVAEVNCSHFLEHLTGVERAHFANELYRVLAPGAKAYIVVPHWCSNRAYGDYTHQWPPVSEFWFFYLDRKWRKEQAPHTDIEFDPHGFDCDFIYSVGYGMDAQLIPRHQEAQMFAMRNYKDAVLEILTTLQKR